MHPEWCTEDQLLHVCCQIRRRRRPRARVGGRRRERLFPRYRDLGDGVDEKDIRPYNFGILESEGELRI